MLPAADDPEIPSAEALGRDYAGWLERITVAKPVVADRVLKFIAAFNLDALRASASQLMKSECTNVYHIWTGGFNAIYLLTFLDRPDVIARLNKEEQTSDQTLLRDRLLSEAATLRYVRAHCSVPVPQVYAINDDRSNPVGARYMLEERVLGKQFNIFAYTPAQRKELSIQIFRYETELMRARFTAIGSIYQRPDDDTLYVGPMGPAVCRLLNHTEDRGPWKSTTEWLKAYVKAELTAVRKDPARYFHLRKAYGHDPTYEYHIAWLETLLATMDRLQYLKGLPPSIERPVLLHEDLSAGNCLVSYKDPTVIAGIIDFEGARVVPLWSALVQPAFCEFRDEEELRLLLNIRHEILCKADPAFAEAKTHRPALQQLQYLLSSYVTAFVSVEQLHGAYQVMKDVWPVHEPAFADLDELVALGPMQYVQHGSEGNEDWEFTPSE